MPLHPTKYAEMLGEKIEKTNVDVWLINTGWSGGEYGIGERISLRHTRAMITSILSNELSNVSFEVHKVNGLKMPVNMPKCSFKYSETKKNTWENKEAYDKKANELANAFNKNFPQFAEYANSEILNAAPKAQKS